VLFHAKIIKTRMADFSRKYDVPVIAAFSGWSCLAGVADCRIKQSIMPAGEKNVPHRPLTRGV
jgi:hypothetical protein